MSRKKKIIYIIIVSFIIIGNLIWYFNFSNTARNKKDQKDKEIITNTYKNVDNTINEDNVIKKYQDMFSNDDIIGELSINNNDLTVPINTINNVTKIGEYPFKVNGRRIQITEIMVNNKPISALNPLYPPTIIKIIANIIKQPITELTL